MSKELLPYYEQIIREAITTDRKHPNVVEFKYKKRNVCVGLYFYRNDIFILYNGLDCGWEYFYDRFGEDLFVLMVNEFENKRFECDRSFQG